MIEHPALAPYVERYVGLRCEPLLVRLYLERGAQLAGYDPLVLDNLLARCVVNEATGWEGLPPENGAEGYLLPVPLQRLWVDARGYPLWAATPFLPSPDVEGDVFYRHKRQQDGQWTRGARGMFRIVATEGRWRDRRTPVPTQAASWWEAECVGNAMEIGRLLAQVYAAGKERGKGYGMVHHWEIDAMESFHLMLPDECGFWRLTRSIPALAIEMLSGAVPQEAPVLTAWTPPQWKPSLYAVGWPMGTAVEIDWMADINGRVQHGGPGGEDGN